MGPIKQTSAHGQPMMDGNLPHLVDNINSSPKYCETASVDHYRVALWSFLQGNEFAFYFEKIAPCFAFFRRSPQQISGMENGCCMHRARQARR